MQNLINVKNGFNKLKQTKYGYCLYNKNDIYVGKSIDLYGEYCDGEAMMLAQICKKGDVVVEVGANIGTHTLMLAKLVGESGKVYAFEPQRIVFQTLCANMAINSIINTYAYNMAVGSENNYIFIPNIDYFIDGNFGGISMQKDYGSEKTSLVKLDDFLDIKSCKLIKIDVEGMEIEVLKGAVNIIQKFLPVIYLENDRIEKSKELIEYLWELEYELYWHTPSLFSQNNFYKNTINQLGNFVSINMLCVHRQCKTKVVGLSKITKSDFHPSMKK